MAAMKSMNTPKTLYLILVISQTRSLYLILHFNFQSTKRNVKCFKDRRPLGDTMTSMQET